MKSSDITELRRELLSIIAGHADPKEAAARALLQLEAIIHTSLDVSTVSVDENFVGERSVATPGSPTRVGTPATDPTRASSKPSSAGSSHRQRNRTGENLSYGKRERQDGFYLVEQRPDTQDFQVPQSVFEAFVAAIAAVRRPNSFKQLHDGTAKKLGLRGKDLPDYQSRIALRFLLNRELVEKVGRQYKPAEATQFPEQADGEWQQLATV